MRHVDKDFGNVKVRKRLTTRTCKLDVTKSVKAYKGNYNSARYGHTEVRDALDAIYHGKCCYCEVKIRPAALEEVEHYRPKAEVSSVNNQGYYWLGNEWSNLLLICRSCNGKKLSKFPLNVPANRVTSHPQDRRGNIDWTKIPYSSGYLSKERPLIINPEHHYPEKLLYHDYTCQLIPIKENRLATTTIKEIDLNNDDLVIKKQEIVGTLINRIEDQLYERYREDEPLSEGQFRRQLTYIFKDITDRVHHSKEFSLLGVNMVERFDELILEDILPVFRKVIRNEFIEFLKSS